MQKMLSGMKTAVIGGDRREIVVMADLLEQGAAVAAAGFPVSMLPPAVSVHYKVKNVLKDADILLLPLSGLDEKGRVHTVYTGEELTLTEKDILQMRPEGLVLTGKAPEFFKRWCQKAQIQVVEIGKLDDLAILNSIPTAEGAVQLAMRETDRTIHGSTCLVLGLGRVGLTLARTLRALGAQVLAADKNSSAAARAQEMGCRTVSMGEIKDAVKQSDMIFNTVPALVLNREILRCTPQNTFILDIASKPGGTDFSAAADFHIKALMAPGLPGKTAPYSAGKIASQIILPLVLQHRQEKMCWNVKEEL